MERASKGVSVIEHMSASAAESEAAPLSDIMLAMDVTDTIRHDPSLADDPLRLAAIYAQQGIALSEAVAADGIAAWRSKRFAYTPPPPGFALTLARLYVWRRYWLPPAVAVGLMFLIGFGGYFLVYKPYRDGQMQQAQVELTKTLPAEMDALYETIHEETKVQQAENDALEARLQGKAAAAKGDRAGAEAAIADLTAIRDTLRLGYQLMIVDRPGVKWGFWTFPEDNSEATNYYLVVEARDATSGTALPLPIRNEQTGILETVQMWGIRVPEEVYRAVEADKTDNGTIQHTLIGIKDFGFLEPDYTVQVLGGTVTRW
jgi:hypothetical protein